MTRLLFRFIVLYLIACFLSSCSNQKDKQEQKADSIDIEMAHSLRQQKLKHFNDSLYSIFEKSPQKLISIYGKPKKSEIREFENVHNGEIDTVYNLDFDTVSVILYYASSQKRYLVGKVDVYSNSLLDIIGFYIDAPDTMVVNSIGLANQAEIDSSGVDIFTYKLGDIAESYTQFHFKDSKLIKVVYLPYFD
jgi:hypothetical protein